MNCKELNMDPICISCEIKSTVNYANSSCWIEWWKQEFITNGVQPTILTSMKAGNMDDYHYFFLRAAIEHSCPEYIEWLDKMIILI